MFFIQGRMPCGSVVTQVKLRHALIGQQTLRGALQHTPPLVQDRGPWDYSLLECVEKGKN